MNMEDRLKAAFEQEAEHLHAPHGSPETAIRRGRRRRASNLIGGAALVFVLIGGTAAGVQYLGSSDDPAPQDLASVTETSVAAAAGTRNAVADFAWERVTLPQPENTSVWNTQVAADGEGFLAIGNGYVRTGDEEGEVVLVWRSTDGTDWTLQTTESPFDGAVDTLLSTEDGFVAVVRTFVDPFDTVTLYSSPDGTAWTRSDVALGDVAEDHYLWFAGAASGNGATVLAGALQTEPQQPPVVFEAAGVVLQQNNRDGSFTVTDLSSGELITEVGAETVYGQGPVVYGPDGELILALTEESMERALSGEDEGRLTIEQDGIRLAIDYEGSRYVATDIATGTVLAEGTPEDLYRGGRLVIVDPNTDETLLNVDMDEFYMAQEDAWNNAGGDYSPETEIMLLTTTDGTSWDRIPLGSGLAEETGVAGIAFGPEGFVLSAFSYGPERVEQAVWRSTNGRDWELSTATATPADGPITSAGDAYYRVGYGNGAAIARSSNGVDWTVVHEPDDRGTYYNEIVAGGLGVLAIGQHQDDSYGPPVVIAKGGRTLVVDGETGRITVTDDATGEVLTTIALDIYQLEAPAQIIEDSEAGTIAITDVDGNVVMEFTEEEANAASENSEREYDYSYPEPAVAFSPNGEDWFTATTVGLDLAWSQSIAVGENTVVLIGNSAEEVYAAPDEVDLPVESGGEGALTTTLAGEYAPATYVWVGRPR